MWPCVCHGMFKKEKNDLVWSGKSVFPTSTNKSITLRHKQSSKEKQKQFFSSNKHKVIHSFQNTINFRVVFGRNKSFNLQHPHQYRNVGRVWASTAYIINTVSPKVKRLF